MKEGLLQKTMLTQTATEPVVVQKTAKENPIGRRATQNHDGIEEGRTKELSAIQTLDNSPATIKDSRENIKRAAEKKRKQPHFQKSFSVTTAHTKRTRVKSQPWKQILKAETHPREQKTRLQHHLPQKRNRKRKTLTHKPNYQSGQQK